MDNKTDWKDGLPTIGCVCEIKYDFQDRFTAKASIIAIHGKWMLLDVEGKDKPTLRAIETVVFRPIKTPEEVALKDLSSILSDSYHLNWAGMAIEIYDAGYRNVGGDSPIAGEVVSYLQAHQEFLCHNQITFGSYLGKNFIITRKPKQ